MAYKILACRENGYDYVKVLNNDGTLIHCRKTAAAAVTFLREDGKILAAQCWDDHSKVRKERVEIYDIDGHKIGEEEI